MTYTVDFVDVSTTGLESSPVADALAGLRANEARYFKNKYDLSFTVQPATEAEPIIDWLNLILRTERDLVIAARPLEVSDRQIDDLRWPHVFYESGLAINVMYALDDTGKRAVGLKLSDGMDVPAERPSWPPRPGSSSTLWTVVPVGIALSGSALPGAMSASGPDDTVSPTLIRAGARM